MDALARSGEGAPTLADLARLLHDRGSCDERMLDRARRVAEETGKRLDSVLIQLGLLTERGLADAYASLLGTTIAPPARYPVAPLFADRLAPRFLRASRCLPVAVEHGRLVVACADPLDPFIPAAIAAATGLPVTLEVALPIEIEAALERLYGDASAMPEAAAAAPDGDAPLAEDAERLRDLASEAPVIRLVNQIIARAVETQALRHPHRAVRGPAARALPLRRRAAGGGQPAGAASPPRSPRASRSWRSSTSPSAGCRRTGASGWRCAGRTSISASPPSPRCTARRSCCACSTAPRSASTTRRSACAAPVIARLRAALDLPNGIVLVTGPTGSGKTTTLYTGLRALNSEARKIVTVEDPIEYQLAGINQIQVKPQIDLTFATLLRSILRQDPDVIMVGEIRDLETAQIAVQAALTGHLVLSTLHTNSAAATITRLRDMGLEDYLHHRRAARRAGAAAGAQALPRLPAGSGRAARTGRTPRPRPPQRAASAAPVARGRLPAMPRHRLSRAPGDRRISCVRMRRSSG